MNRARLNHILIPAGHEGRQRLRRSFFGRLLAPLGWLFGALTREGHIAGLLLLFVGTAALDVVSTPIYLLWCLLVAVLVGSLCGRVVLRLKGVRLTVVVGARATVATALTMTVVVHNDGEHEVHALRLKGPFLPWDGHWLRRPPPVRSLAAGARV
ncbi:MAG TPA: hypothetical protein ENK23_05440, partial [Sorangium sp.]|nr:hypothetical protein [Sorangium sp.]